MFICNLKINGKKIWKVTLIILITLITLLMIFVLSKIFKSDENMTKSNAIDITSDSYTSFLKDCHENIDNYIDRNFTITGYVYRMPDFTNNQFVLSRTMIINEANSAVVVGILCECQKACEFSDGDWITVTGTIVKGNYKGEMPILEIKEINKCNKPEDEYVYPPSGEINL